MVRAASRSFMLQIRTVVSSEDEAICLPSGPQAILEMESVWSENLQTTSPFLASHICTVPRAAPLLHPSAIYVPSGDQTVCATSICLKISTVSVCPLKLSQMRSIPSSSLALPPEAIYFPSGDQVMPEGFL